MVLPDRSNKCASASQKLPLQRMNFFQRAAVAAKQLRLLAAQQLFSHMLLLNSLNCLLMAGKSSCRTFCASHQKFSSGMIQFDASACAEKHRALFNFFEIYFFTHFVRFLNFKYSINNYFAIHFS